MGERSELARTIYGPGSVHNPLTDLSVVTATWAGRRIGAPQAPVAGPPRRLDRSVGAVTPSRNGPWLAPGFPAAKAPDPGSCALRGNFPATLLRLRNTA